MARATYIYHLIDKKTGDERSFTVKHEMVKHVQLMSGKDDPNKRFHAKRFRDGQDIHPQLFAIPHE